MHISITKKILFKFRIKYSISKKKTYLKNYCGNIVTYFKKKMQKFVSLHDTFISTKENFKNFNTFIFKLNN